ncbi:SRPBCC domain-containing protein [Pseudofrankia asymbiotica]|uniref:Polyketide cyclase n=1 Tax=Pseudofrankia asymbiotica TaxID=1834516 RepID=A0A1V2I3Z7_9ACTN|nr:SRPBCC domain-containing protein [Pseudofrankia asymbiotica]ONH25284.1 polyketide cyclase [Pseudofrankia asymbiotica]
MYATQVSWRIWAPRPAVYRALLDPATIARWRAPTGTRAQIHTFEAREGGTFRISLVCDQPTPAATVAVRTGVYHGRFLRLVPDTQVVEQLAFETDDPPATITMTTTTTLSDAGTGATAVLVVHDGVPDVIPAADSETATRMALAKFAEIVEKDQPPP